MGTGRYPWWPSTRSWRRFFLPDVTNRMQLAFDGPRHAAEALRDFFVAEPFQLPQGDAAQSGVVEQIEMAFAHFGDFDRLFSGRLTAESSQDLLLGFGTG